MAAEAVALLKDFYATGNPKGALYLGTQAHLKLLSSVSVPGRAKIGLTQEARDKSKRKEGLTKRSGRLCSGSKMLIPPSNVWCHMQRVFIGQDV